MSEKLCYNAQNPLVATWVIVNTRDWTVFELDPANQDNMNRGGPANNIDTYAICVVAAPKAMKTVMSPAHDDHAQIWINGDKWYNNTTWTGGAQVVNYNIEVKLKKGANSPEIMHLCEQKIVS